MYFIFGGDLFIKYTFFAISALSKDLYLQNEHGKQILYMDTMYQHVKRSFQKCVHVRTEKLL